MSIWYAVLWGGAFGLGFAVMLNAGRIIGGVGLALWFVACIVSDGLAWAFRREGLSL